MKHQLRPQVDLDNINDLRIITAWYELQPVGTTIVDAEGSTWRRTNYGDRWAGPEGQHVSASRVARRAVPPVRRYEPEMSK